MRKITAQSRINARIKLAELLERVTKDAKDLFMLANRTKEAHEDVADALREHLDTMQSRRPRKKHEYIWVEDLEMLEIIDNNLEHAIDTIGDAEYLLDEIRDELRPLIKAVTNMERTRYRATTDD